MKRIRMASVLFVCAMGTAFSANAGLGAVLQNGTYQLHSHPNGGIRPPLYGLRLDGLDGTNSHDYTFDFDAAGSDMRMTVDLNAGSVRIFGVTFGGRDMGSAYQNPSAGTTGLWQIDFTYSANVQVHGNGEITAHMSPQNNGYIQPLFASNVNAFQNNPQIPLVDFNGNPQAPSFHLNTGHRGVPGVSGWGWVNHSGAPHVYASDWLFTVGANPIPSPGAASLGMIGLAVAGMMRRRS